MLWIVQVETSREASTVALQELSAKLQQEYDEKLREEQRKHREEIENLQVCILHSLFIHLLSALYITCSVSARRYQILCVTWTMDVRWLCNTSQMLLPLTHFYKEYNAVQIVSDIQPETQVNYSIYVNCRVFSVHPGPTRRVHQATRGSREKHQDCRGQDCREGPEDHGTGASTGLYEQGKAHLDKTKVKLSAL